MKFSIIPTPLFKREAKRLVKKYPSVKEELIAISEDLSNNPRLGIDLGNNTYKIRIAIKSKGKGKSGGGRIITYVMLPDAEVYLLSIYDKSEFDTIDKEVLKSLIEEIKTNK